MAVGVGDAVLIAVPGVAVGVGVAVPAAVVAVGVGVAAGQLFENKKSWFEDIGLAAAGILI